MIVGRGRVESVCDLKPLREAFHDEGEASSRALALIMIEEVDPVFSVEQPVVALAAPSEDPPLVGPFAANPVVSVGVLSILLPCSRLAEEDQARLEFDV